MFGAHLSSAETFAGLLCSQGVQWGLLGPREPERIWERHLLNCAVVAELFEAGSRIVDVGSGAGLPGLALAIARPDLHVDLVEPLQRRCDFLVAAIEALSLADRVRVVRARAEVQQTQAEVGTADWVTARAVAPIDRLMRWCLPLVSSTGQLALLKGASAEQELASHRSAVRRAGGRDPRVVSCGAGVLATPTVVVVMGRTERTGRR